MKTRYKFINFKQSIVDEKAWRCFNNKTNYQLGYIGYNVAWKQYCFYPDGNSVFSSSCLLDIVYFIKQLK